MTEQGRQVAEVWQDPQFAAAWAEADSMGDILAFPRRIAAALVGQDRPETRLVLDIGSGPGAFVAAFLDEFPAAHGICTDASEPMLVRAKEALAAYGDRVSFRTLDMTDLSTVDLPAPLDVVTTSRAAHHLDRDGLATYYRQAGELLAPGGWIVNLDHTGPEDKWDQRFRDIRPRFNRRGVEEPKHHHNYPLTSIQDHLDGLHAAGFTDVEIAWKAFYTCLFIGRKDG
jgi:SAM-dependent methyltransferase